MTDTRIPSPGYSDLPTDDPEERVGPETVPAPAPGEPDGRRTSVRGPGRRLVALVAGAWRWFAGLVPERWRPWVRAILLGAYGGVLVASIKLRGIPFEREQVIFWICGALLIWSLWRERWWRVLTDWLPFLLLMAIYDRTRGVAETLGMPIQWEPQLRVDQFLFFGQVPTVWLQDRLYQSETQWWQVITGVTYVSHFVVTFVVAGVLWVRSRTGFVAYARRFLTLSYLGLATYILVPAAPPWKAGREGYIDPVNRLAGRGWSRLGLERAENLIEKGQVTVNLFAAVPSLHAAYTMLVAVFLWKRARWWWRPLLAAYPLVMAFTLVYGGEHYVSDILLGWVYVAAVMLGWGWWDRWRAARRAEADQLSTGGGGLGPPPALMPPPAAVPAGR